MKKLNKQTIVIILIGALISGFFTFQRLSKKNTSDELKEAAEKFKSKDFQSSIDICSEIIASYPDNAVAYEIRGTAYSEIEDTIAAINDLSKAIELKPDFANAYYMRATNYGLLGKYKEVIEDLSNALKYNLNDSSVEIFTVYYIRGYANYKVNNYSNATADYDKAIELKPNFPGTYVMKAAIKMEEGDQVGFCIDIKKAADLGDVDAATAYEKNCN